MKKLRFILFFLAAILFAAFALDAVAAQHGPAVAVACLFGVGVGLPAMLFTPSPKWGADAFTQLADLWVPQVWANARREAKIKATSFLQSGVVVTDNEINMIASGLGSDAQIPFFIEADPTDQIQLERTAPEVKKLTSGMQRCPVLQRVSPLGGTALSRAMSGADPIAEILASLDAIRMRQRATALQNQLSGLYGLASTAGAATGVFRALRLDNFVEVVGSITASHLIDSDMIIDGIQLMGEAKTRMEGGVILMHSVIEAALTKQEKITTVFDSDGKLVMKTYKGMQVWIDDRLVRAGTTSGFVYSTFVCMRGSIAMGEKPQIFTDQAGEVAAVQVDSRNLSLNEQVVYDRTRYILHPQGAKWSPQAGVPANASDKAGTATNAELADPANWALAFADARNVGIICIRSNG